MRKSAMLMFALLGTGCDYSVPKAPVVSECAVENSAVVKGLKSMIDYYQGNESPRIKRKADLQDSGFVLELQEALFFHGYLDKTPDGVLDDQTTDSIIDYKRRNALHGQSADNLFLSHLSTPSEVRVKLLQESLKAAEKFDLENDIYVNIPEFKMRYYFGGDLKLSMDIIVGNGKVKPSGSGRWRTVVQKGTIEDVVVNPLWAAASKDLVEDTKKDLRASASFRKHMEQYIDGKWVPVDSSVNGSKFRQMPGPWSLQGRINFDFKGGYGESLHGTPYKYLFDKNVRNFSHGCMRIEDEVALFEKFQEFGVADPSIDIYDLTKDNGVRLKTMKVKLLNPVDVKVVYLRSWVDGSVMMMFPDIYGYNNSIAP